MEIKLSIIIPMYNAEKTIKRCVQSTICQNQSSIEVILINDGSTDCTEEMCRQLQEMYGFIKYFKVDNGGVSRARNIGIEKALGKWIMFIDSDDYLEDGTIDFCLNILQNDEMEIVHFGAVRDYIQHSKHIGSKKMEMSIFEQINKDYACLKVSQDFETLFDNNFFDAVWGKMFKSSIIYKNRIRFDEKMKIREDSVFVLNYCRHIDKAILLNYNGYHYQIKNDETYQFRINVEIWEIERLYQAYSEVISRGYKKRINIEEKICSFMFHVLLLGIIHNSARRYAGSFSKLKYYLIDGMNNTYVYSCIMKSKTRSSFLNLVIYLLRKKRITLVTTLCFCRFRNT